MPQTRRSNLPPAHRRSRRRFPLRLLAVAIVLLAAAFLLVSICSSGGKQPKARNDAQPTAGAAPAAPSSRAAAGSRGGSPRPGATPGVGGFAPVSPTPQATCAPSDLLRLVDKDHALPDDYLPPDLVNVEPKDASPGSPTVVQLRKEADGALHSMLEAARAQNIFFLAQSAYRSYQYQSQVYQQEVNSVGQAQADRESARPGHSEHQLGLAIDFTTRGLDFDLNQSFAATPEGRWLAQHAAEFGFVLSYPEGKEAQTGYEYEPWHYRYIGTGAAQQFVQSGQTLNQWLTSRQLGCGA
ncbi:MAG TPA: M15 family metallopeptidase [Dehalococcoidia bacterium]|nr:M15 family metallopeptidase [Dehalococcoidia bacterium]